MYVLFLYIYVYAYLFMSIYNECFNMKRRLFEFIKVIAKST